MNRRGFLGSLGALVAGAAFDPEPLLWVPGRKLISIPPASAGLCVRVIRQISCELAAREGLYVNRIEIANVKLNVPRSDDFDVFVKDDCSVTSADQIVSAVLGVGLSDQVRDMIHQVRNGRPNTVASMLWYPDWREKDRLPESAVRDAPPMISFGPSNILFTQTWHGIRPRDS